MRHILILFVWLIASDTVVAQRTLNLKTLESKEGVEETIPTRDIEEVADGLIVTYTFDRLILQDDPLFENLKLAKVNGFWLNTKEGEPSVPIRWDTFIVPNSESNVVVVDSSYVDLPLELSPSRPLLSNSGNTFYTKESVKPISQYEGYFPKGTIPYTRKNKYREQPLLEVCISPVQYDCVNKKTRIYTKIQYKIQYGEKFNRTRFTAVNNSLKGNPFLQNIALNGSLYTTRNERSGVAQQIATSGYQIISVPKYASAVYKFAEWKRTLGFNVIVSMQSSWDTTSVKNVVSTNNIEHLLIIGGQNDVPGVIRHQVVDGELRYYPTDLYYGCMTSGYNPIIHRGRIPVSTEAEAMTVVNKIIDYEKNPVSDNDFYNTAVHCAYFEDQKDPYYGRDGYEDRRFTQTSERIRNRMLSLINTVYRVYWTEMVVTPTHWNYGDYGYGEAIPNELLVSNYPWDGNASNITNHINNKAFYVLIRDHGNVQEWAYPYYSTNHINSLENGNYLPVVFSICCLTGKFNESNCFCEAFLKKEDGGCVAIYGATQSSLSGANDVLAEGMFDAIWPSSDLLPHFPTTNPSSYYTPTPTPTYRLGQILDQGLKRVDEAYLGTLTRSWYPRYTSELFHCFGDPSMMICTESPSTFTNASIVRQDGVITVNTGGETATITYYNRRTGLIESFVGTFHTYTDDPEISICISAHNKVPYIDMGSIYIQNTTLSNSGYYEANTINVGNHVTTNQAQGDVFFLQGNYKLAGNEIELHPGTNISVGASVEIGR